MVGLSGISTYVQKTSIILGSVLEMDILVCDRETRLIGDTDLTDTSTEYLSPSSILTRAMKTRETFIIEDRQSQCRECEMCPKNEECSVIAIIAFPIQKNGQVFGAIGIYANSYEMREKLLSKQVFFIEFISNMSDLLISKLEEKEENTELKAFQKKFSMIVESIDMPILGIDENREIIHCNQRLRNLLQLSSKTQVTMDRLFKVVKQSKFRDFLLECNEDSEKEFLFDIKGRETSVLVSADIVKIKKEFKGAILHFKKVEDLYDEVNRVTNNYTQFAVNQIIGNSPAVKKLKSNVENFAKSNSTILIQGESGTGKGVFARAFHSESDRCSNPFVVVNCAAIPDNLLESELFGHEEGAFTGSMKGGRVGKFELANKGTLFLDEIGELPLHLQAKLLRAVQEKKIERVGGNADIHVDIRIIAATNKDLEEMMKRGEFRQDLYYRLNVIPFVVPPLRERLQDIVLMINYFIHYYSQTLKKHVDGIRTEAEEALLSYSWPGNVRELQNVIEYAVNVTKSTWITTDDIPERILYKTVGQEQVRIRKLSEIEDYYIQEALRQYGSDLPGKERAAQMLGISRATLYRKLKEQHLQG